MIVLFSWKCYKCNNKCPCLTCEKKIENGKMLGMKRGASRARITIKQTKSRRSLKFRRKEEKPEEKTKRKDKNRRRKSTKPKTMPKMIERVSIKFPQKTFFSSGICNS